MTYPDLPNNRMIVNGVDLSERYGLILADGYTLSPPSIKTYTIDIPGGNGKLDLTESLLGDTAYDNREQEFNFYVIKPYSFEQAKTDVSRFLHGREFDYQITMDPDYTYHGRFTVESYEHGMYDFGVIGVIKIKIDANPFKIREPVSLKANAVGGIELELASGRKSVTPIFQTFGVTTIIFEDKKYTLTQGTWRVNDIIFKSGTNYLYLNTYPVRIVTWGDINDDDITWGALKTKKIYQWYKYKGFHNMLHKTWGDLPVGDTWANHSTETWKDQQYKQEDVSKIKDVKLKYDWGDL